MQITSLESLVIHDLGIMYDAETRFLAAQQQMLPYTSARPLQQLLQEHIAQTEQQIRNLEQIFQILGQPQPHATSEAAAGLVAEGKRRMHAVTGNAHLLDCVIASIHEQVEHYELATYRTLVTLCQELGQGQVAQLLQQNLHQEEQKAQQVERHMPMLIGHALGSRAIGGH
jgi:ferritin-like metal-binding protein YciE